MPTPTLLIAGGALGGTPSSVTADGFVVTTTTLPPRTRLPLHAHERANLNLVFAGCYTERVGSRSWTVPPRSCVVKPAGAAHENVIGGAAARCVVVELEPWRLRAIGEHTPLFDDVRVLGDATFATFGLRLLRELGAPDAVTPLSLPGLVLEFVGDAARSSSRRTRDESERRPAWLADVVELLVDAGRGASPVPTTTAVAAAARHHPSYVARVFRRHYGMSMGEFVRARRVEHATRMLLDTRRPLSQVALDLGYADQSHFTRAFRGRTGVTPSQFRRSAGITARPD